MTRHLLAGATVALVGLLIGLLAGLSVNDAGYQRFRDWLDHTTGGN